MNPPNPVRPRRGRLLAVLGLALGIRLAHWAVVRDEPFVAFPIMDSETYLSWAHAIAGGDWLARGEFFLAPLYPYLLAALLAVSGGSLDAAYLFQIATAVGAIALVFRTGQRLGGRRSGLVGAGLCALCGPMVFHDVLLLKESLATSLVALLLWILTRDDLGRRSGTWLAAGLTWGAIGLLRENALLLLPFLLGIAWVRRPGLRPVASAGSLLVAGYLLAMLPFAVRGQIVTGNPLPTFNAGFNVYIGNNPDATGTYQPIVAGKTVPEAEGREPVRLASERVGRELTPQQASRYWLGQSLRWMVREPGAFLELQARKVGLFWRFYEWPDVVDYYWMRERSLPLRLAFVEFGALALLAVAALWSLRTRLRAWAPVLLLVVGWTFATVLFFVFSRFRVPILPALALLAAVPVVRCFDAFQEGRRGRALAGASLVVLALGVPYLLAHEPDRRLVAYNLAGVYLEAGETELARTAYLEALAASPDDFTVMLRLGDVALREGRLPEAIGWYEQGTRARPDADDPWAQLGRALALSGDPHAAEAALERALELNPRNVTALHGDGILALMRDDLPAARAARDRIDAARPGHPAAELLSRRIREAEERNESDTRKQPSRTNPDS